MKNIEDLKKRLWSRMRNYTDDKKLLKRYMNDLNLIQTEYDKSIKDEELEFMKKLKSVYEIDIINDTDFGLAIIQKRINELLSKIGDNSEVEK